MAGWHRITDVYNPIERALKVISQEKKIPSSEKSFLKEKVRLGILIINTLAQPALYELYRRDMTLLERIEATVKALRSKNVRVPAAIPGDVEILDEIARVLKSR